MNFLILGIGTATPPRRIAQQDAAVLAGTLVGSAARRERTLSAVYRQTRIAHRGSVLLDDPGDAAFAQSFFPPARNSDDAGPSTAARMDRYCREAPGLAAIAVERALAASTVSPAEVTHLVTCSCTGFAAPGVDLALIETLGLPATVARTHVGFMGCHGAFNALRVAAAFGSADPAAVVLVVCVELCSLHFQYGSEAEQIVANSIFADGAAAVVGRGSPDQPTDRQWTLVDQRSAILADSASQMGWTIGDHGFEMTLSAEVPGTIANQLPALLDELLATHSLNRSNVDHWAVHPGGPRVLSAVESAINLAPNRLAASRAVLAEHGNMSSSTILFILEQLFLGGDSLTNCSTSKGSPETCVAMAFGPGLTAELALLVSQP